MKLWLKYLGFAAVASTVTLASCGDDEEDLPPPIETNTAPTLSLENPDMTQMGSMRRLENLDREALAEFVLVAEDIDDNIQAITVFQDGDQLSTANGPIDNVRIEFDGMVQALDNNPRLLVTADTAGFRKRIRLRAPADFNDSTTYTITINDSGLNGVDREEASVDVTLVTGAPPVNLRTKSDIEFFNFSGPNRGAVDLDLGEPVPSDNATALGATAELQDSGNGPNGWARTVTADNGATLRLGGDDVDFDNIRTLSDLLSAYDEAGDANDITVTGTIEEGQVYFVTRTDADGNDLFYVVRFDEVNNTDNDNRDSYVITVKRV